MSKPYEEDGYLWEPGQEQGRASAHVAFDPGFGTRITIIDAKWAGDVASHWAVLHGESLWGQQWTLFEVRGQPAQKTPWRSDHSRTEASAWRLVTGGHFGTEEDIELTTLQLRCHGMREWLTQGRRDRASALHKPDDAPDDFWGSVRATAGGVRAVFSVAWVGGGDWYRHHKEANATLQLESDEPLSLSAWLHDWVTPTQDLLLFAMRHPTATISLSGHDARTASSESGPIHVEVLEAWTTLPTQMWTAYMGRALLPANAVDNPSDLLGRWFTLREELGDAAQLFFATLNDRGLPSVNRLLNVLAFAESYHRRRHNEPPLTAEQHDACRAAMLGALASGKERDVYDSRLQHANAQSQRQRIRWLVKRAATADHRLLDLSKPLVSSLIETRNRLTHFEGDGPWVTTTVFGYSLLAAALEYVLEANLLLDLGLAAGVVAECLAEGHGWDDPLPELPHDEAPGRF